MISFIFLFVLILCDAVAVLWAWNILALSFSPRGIIDFTVETVIAIAVMLWQFIIIPGCADAAREKE